MDKKIGEKLKRGEALSVDEEHDFRSFPERHDDAITEVVAGLSGFSDRDGQPLVITPRVKTRPTIAEKLQRESARLSQVQDIAGARLVTSGGRSDQDAIVEEILARFPQAKPVIDRRVSPSYGYRAGHVVLSHADCWVEIQVRTRLQHLWAEVVERLADSWGRQIRYGDLPSDPDREWGEWTRREGLEILVRLSELIASVETTVVRVEETARLQDHAERQARFTQFVLRRRTRALRVTLATTAALNEQQMKDLEGLLVEVREAAEREATGQ